MVALLRKTGTRLAECPSPRRRSRGTDRRKDVKMKLRRALALLVVTVVSWSCGDGTGPDGDGGNRSPQLSAIGNMSLAVGELRDVTVQATDPDGDDLTFSIESNPGFATITKTGQTGNVATARLTLEPGPGHVGTHTVTVRVTDGRGGSATDDCTVEVEGADVTLTLALPGDAQGLAFGIFIDTDVDPENGYVSGMTGTADAGTELTYSLGAVAAGSYFAYAAVCVVSGDCEPDLLNGDWLGIYGTPITLDLSPESGYVGDYVTSTFDWVANAIVPSSGVASFDITLHEYVSEEVELSLGDVSATEFIVSWDDNAFTLNFFMPNAGAAGSHQVAASFEGGVFSDAAPWTQVIDGDPTDPENDDPQTAVPIEIPVDGVGSFLNGDVVDWYVFIFDAGTTIEFLLNWNNEKDLDVIVFDVAGEPECSAATYYDKPEHAVCTLPAGTHYVAIIDYDAFAYDDFALVSYRGTGWIPQGALSASASSRPAIDPTKAAVIERLRR